MRARFFFASALSCSLMVPAFAAAQGIPEKLVLLVENLQKEVATLKTQIAELERQPGPKGDKGDQGSTGARGETGARGSDGRDATVPLGAVVAFDLQSGCPDGWTEFERARGRMLLGANPNKTYGYVERPFGSDGGAETHTLDFDEMPNHDHTYLRSVGEEPRAAGKNATYVLVDSAQGRGKEKVDDGGGADAHNNIPPYVALYFCKKD